MGKLWKRRALKDMSKITDFIDNFLNSITMYRLILYYLILLVCIAFIYSIFGILHFDAIGFLFSSLFLVAVCYLTNNLFAKIFKVPANVESLYISALILALIITPAQDVHDLIFLFWAATLAMASKYILGINHKHLFNPVAISVFITAVAINQSASWWVATGAMVPFVLIGGVLMVRKIQRTDLVMGFLITAFMTVMFFGILKGVDPVVMFQKTLIESPILFLAFVMLTEPLTTPPTVDLRIYYGIISGFLFAPQLHIGSFYTTPELALLVGNVFSFIVSPKERLILKLKHKRKLTEDIYDFVFELPKRLDFKPGQYMEWTLEHKNPDARGNRRYFTLASSPTEDVAIIGVKYYKNSSSFKRRMFEMKTGDEIVAGQRAGDFTLPNDPAEKLVFIAGGIGITPFRSMIKYLIDIKEERDIVLFYSNRSEKEIVYRDVFDNAKNLGVKVVYVNTNTMGRLSSEMIVKEVPDFKERVFYLSGPHAMVVAFEDTLHQMGVERAHIKTDFFPGYV
jgi:ferredoxin-NADP reductase